MLELSQALAKGCRIADRYQIERVLGQGGFAWTYVAQDLRLHRVVVLKELFPWGSVRPLHLPQDVQNTFLAEGQALARIRHPHIVQVLDSISDEQGCFLVLEYLDGPSLAEWCGEVRDVSVALPPMLEALEVVHQAGVVHRDIKPDNIRVCERGWVLLDFGAARTMANAVRTYTQMVTAGYAPPEQYTTRIELTPASDIYALGATLYQVLAGEAPPSAPDRLMGATIAPLQGIPKAWNDTILDMLALQPSQRPQSIAELRQRLPLTAAEPILSPPPVLPPENRPQLQAKLVARWFTHRQVMMLGFTPHRLGIFGMQVLPRQSAYALEVNQGDEIVDRWAPGRAVRDFALNTAGTQVAILLADRFEIIDVYNGRMIQQQALFEGTCIHFLARQVWIGDSLGQLHIWESLPRLAAWQLRLKMVVQAEAVLSAKPYRAGLVCCSRNKIHIWHDVHQEVNLSFRVQVCTVATQQDYWAAGGLDGLMWGNESGIIGHRPEVGEVLVLLWHPRKPLLLAVTNQDVQLWSIRDGGELCYSWPIAGIVACTFTAEGDTLRMSTTNEVMDFQLLFV